MADLQAHNVQMQIMDQNRAPGVNVLMVQKDQVPQTHHGLNTLGGAKTLMQENILTLNTYIESKDLNKIIYVIITTKKSIHTCIQKCIKICSSENSRYKITMWREVAHCQLVHLPFSPVSPGQISLLGLELKCLKKKKSHSQCLQQQYTRNNSSNSSCSLVC